MEGELDVLRKQMHESNEALGKAQRDLLDTSIRCRDLERKNQILESRLKTVESCKAEARETFGSTSNLGTLTEQLKMQFDRLLQTNKQSKDWFNQNDDDSKAHWRSFLREHEEANASLDAFWEQFNKQIIPLLETLQYLMVHVQSWTDVHAKIQECEVVNIENYTTLQDATQCAFSTTDAKLMARERQEVLIMRHKLMDKTVTNAQNVLNSVKFKLYAIQELASPRWIYLSFNSVARTNVAKRKLEDQEFDGNLNGRG